MSESHFEWVLPQDQLAEGECRLVVVPRPEGADAEPLASPELRILLCKLGGEVYAMEDRCTHDGGHLGATTLQGREVTCPRHGARFDITTGKPTRLPALRPARTFPVRIQGGVIQVDLAGS